MRRQVTDNIECYIWRCVGAKRNWRRLFVVAVLFYLIYHLRRSIKYQENFVSSEDVRDLATQQTRLRFAHDYAYHLNPGQAVCGPEHHPCNLLILVASAVGHRERRDAIRATWGRSADLDSFNAKLVFLLGTPAVSELSVKTSLEDEFNMHNDIVQESFIDSYANLTLKTIGGIKWANNLCKQAKYVMKTDDDIYVNLPRLVHFLGEQSKQEKHIYGCIKNVNGAPQPIAMSGVAFPTRHPPFTAGAGYIITGDLIPQLTNIAQNISIIRVEDAFLTGYCATRAGGVERVHSNLFSCGQMVDKNCDMKNAVNGHKITPDRMHQMYSDLRLLC